METLLPCRLICRASVLLSSQLPDNLAVAWLPDGVGVAAMLNANLVFSSFIQVWPDFFDEAILSGLENFCDHTCHHSLCASLIKAVFHQHGGMDGAWCLALGGVIISSQVSEVNR